MAVYTVGGRGARSGSMSSFSTTTTNKNSLMNRILEKGMGSLTSGEQATARSLMTPEEMASVTGKSLSGGGGAGSAGSGNGSGSGGGGVDATSLMELYQKGLGAGGNSDLSADDQLRLLREGNKIDMESRQQQQSLQLEGQDKLMKQTQEARARERDTEATLQRNQQSRERGNAMAAYRGL